MFSFENLNVWKKSINYCSNMIDIANNLPNKYFYSFGTQLIRAALSITNNIAEGSGRRSKKESSNFYNIAKGSAYETINIVMVLVHKKLIPNNLLEINYPLAEEISKMLSGLIKEKK